MKVSIDTETGGVILEREGDKLAIAYDFGHGILIEFREDFVGAEEKAGITVDGEPKELRRFFLGGEK